VTATLGRSDAVIPGGEEGSPGASSAPGAAIPPTAKQPSPRPVQVALADEAPIVTARLPLP
jgi:hypothetical protein